jgi:hypothetical protein
MKNEMVVKQLIAISEAVRIGIAQYLGPMEYPDQHRRLSSKEKIDGVATQNGWNSADVFAELLQRIEDGINALEPIDFELHHLRAILSDNSIRQSIAVLLKWSDSDEILDRLFNVKAISRTLSRAPGAVTFDSTTVSRLLNRLCSDDALYDAILRNEGCETLGDIIALHRWLESEARDILVQRFRISEKIDSLVSLRVIEYLASHIDALQSSHQAEQNDVDIQRARRRLDHGSQTLDTLGVVYLRAHIESLIHSLHEQMTLDLVAAQQFAPATCFDAMLQLNSWLQFYELEVVVPALESFITGKKPLKHWLPRHDEHPLEADELDKASDKPFVVPRQAFTTTLRPGANIHNPDTVEVVSFEIHCLVQNENGKEKVLTCYQIPAEEFESYCAEIEELSVNELSREGDSVSKRLLNTAISNPRPMSALLRRGIKEMGAKFYQCALLSGQPLPTMSHLPWREELNDKPPYTVVPPQNEVVFHRDIQHTVDRITRDYSERGRTLKIVS